MWSFVLLSLLLVFSVKASVPTTTYAVNPQNYLSQSSNVGHVNPSDPNSPIAISGGVAFYDLPANLTYGDSFSVEMSAKPGTNLYLSSINLFGHIQPFDSYLYLWNIRYPGDVGQNNVMEGSMFDNVWAFGPNTPFDTNIITQASSLTVNFNITKNGTIISSIGGAPLSIGWRPYYENVTDARYISIVGTLVLKNITITKITPVAYAVDLTGFLSGSTSTSVNPNDPNTVLINSGLAFYALPVSFAYGDYFSVTISALPSYTLYLSSLNLFSHIQPFDSYLYHWNIRYPGDTGANTLMEGSMANEAWVGVNTPFTTSIITQASSLTIDFNIGMDGTIHSSIGGVPLSTGWKPFYEDVTTAQYLSIVGRFELQSIIITKTFTPTA